MVEAVRLCPSCQGSIPGEARVCPACGAISLPGGRGSLGEEVAERLRTSLGPRYHVEREVGEGGMAVVFRAHDLRHDRAVALKVLRPELSAFLGAERFLREIHIAAQLNHPHILALHDSGEADGLLFYVMPFVEGESLRHRLGRVGALPVAEARTIAAEVADGLAYAHELGVVHRDIKPENILLSHGHAAIADFGIARALVGAGGGAAITTTGMSVGTPIYMSPEQAAGDHALDHRTDIYSLGCVLFEMLTGHPPYRGETPQALLAQHAGDPVPSAHAERPEVPRALDAAVRRAMAKSAADRFQTAGGMRDAVTGAVTGEAGAPPPPRAARRAAPARPALRRVLALVAVTAVVAAAAVLLSRPHPPPAPGGQLRVVVRPFDDRSAPAAGAGTGARLTEVLTERLQSVPALVVPAATVVADLGSATLDTLRAHFNADRVVMGRVDATRDSLLVTAEIVDARTAAGLAHTTVAVPRDDVVAAAQPLSVFLRHALWAELDSVQRRARVRDPAAWDLVWRADALQEDAEQAITLRLDRQGFHALDVADSLLALARRRDGGSDLIPVEQARVDDKRAFYVEYLRQMLPSLPGSLPDPVAARRRGIAALDRLIAQRHGPADAYSLRGRLKDGLYRETKADSLLSAAIADYRVATELDRGNATAWKELASAYGSAGRYADALLANQHAVEADAFLLHSDQLLRGRFDASLLGGQPDSAAAACRAGLASRPPNPLLDDCEVLLWSRTRNDRRLAAAARAKVDALAASAAGTISAPLRELYVAEILARGGLGDSADRVARRATAHPPEAWLPLLLPEEAYLRMLRHDTDSALALVAAAARLDPTARPALRSAPWFAPLRDDPRFERALAGDSGDRR